MEPWQGVKVPYVLFKSIVQQTLISRMINASAPVQEEPKGNSITQWIITRVLPRELLN